MQVTIITGASEGIGAEIARQMAIKGRKSVGLVLASRRAEALAGLAAELRPTGTRIEIVPTDVSSRVDCDALVAATVERFGRIDTLLNNAGRSAHANFSEVRPEKLDWYEDLMRVNFWGPVWLTHAALPHLVKSRGRIGAVSSVAGIVGVPGRTAYSATKFALCGFFEALRSEIAGQGVSVTIAYPGVVDTEIRRHGYAADGGTLGVNALKDDKMMPVDVCARLIVEGIEQRRRDVLMTHQSRLARWLKLAAPGFVDHMARRAVKVEHLPGASRTDRGDAR